MSYEQTPLTGNDGYDRDLLAAAPAPTKADRQEGYNVDLLDESRNNSNPQLAKPRSTNATTTADAENGHVVPSEKLGVRKTPFYKTRVGIIALVVLFLVVVGAVVGGAVGGTRHKSSSNNTGSTSTASSSASATSTVSGGAAPVGSDSAQPSAVGVGSD